MPFTVLYVCTGNICRSPVAELLFRHRLRPGADVTVSSAGVRAVVGAGIDRSAASALIQLGIDPTDHRARQFENWMAQQADLVLTATREQRDTVMRLTPAAFRRAFTMKEFLRLASGVSRGEASAVVGSTAGRRGYVPTVPTAADDVPDPYGRPIAEVMTVAEVISETVYATLAALGFAAEHQVRVSESSESDRRNRPSPYEGRGPN